MPGVVVSAPPFGGSCECYDSEPIAPSRAARGCRRAADSLRELFGKFSYLVSKHLHHHLPS